MLKILSPLICLFSSLYADGVGATEECPVVPEVPSTRVPLSPDAALKKLIQGNQRFMTGKTIHIKYDEEARGKMLEGQSPFAAIIGCSDSRATPELVFNQGLGELFVVKDAGNVIGPIELESLEFAAVVLEVPLIMVLGHQQCGAIKAVLAKQGCEIKTIAALIEPAVKQCGKIRR